MHSVRGPNQAHRGRLLICPRQDSKWRNITAPFVETGDQLLDIALCRSHIESICSKLSIYETYVSALRRNVR